MTDRPAVDDAVERVVAALGRLDVVVASAGRLPPSAPLEAVDAAVLSATLATNVEGVFHTLAATLPHLRRTRVYAFTLSSVAGTQGMAGLAPYVASKWAVLGLTDIAPAGGGRRRGAGDGDLPRVRRAADGRRARRARGEEQLSPDDVAEVVPGASACGCGRRPSSARVVLERLAAVG